MNGNYPIRYQLTGVPRQDPRYRTAIEDAAAALRRGMLVAFPTETVYGLGGSIQRDDALDSIYRVKGRPPDNPLIVHVAGIQQARSICATWPGTADAAARAFWPGPLTIVLPRAPWVTDKVTAGLDTVAVRVPAQRVALDLVALAGPVAAPSANRSGRPSPTEADHVWEDLGDQVAVILDDGPCTIGVESTVVDCTGVRPLILRFGGVSREELERVVGPVDELSSSGEDEKSSRSPGTRYRHYAPNTPLIVVVDPDPSVLALKIKQRIDTLRRQGYKVGLLASDQFIGGIQVDASLSLGDYNDLSSAAAKLFSGLRQLDRMNLDYIVAHSFPPQGLGEAINDRLLRASVPLPGGEVMNAKRVPRRVLFVCTGNTCRSPMAEALFKKLVGEAGGNFEVRSAGTAAVAGMPMTRDAVETLKQRGIDNIDHHSRALSASDIEWAEIILTMTRAQKELVNEMFPEAEKSQKVYTLAEYVGKDDDIEDPFGCGLEAYGRCATVLEGYIRQLLQIWNRESSQDV